MGRAKAAKWKRRMETVLESLVWSDTNAGPERAARMAAIPASAAALPAETKRKFRKLFKLRKRSR